MHHATPCDVWQQPAPADTFTAPMDSFAFFFGNTLILVVPGVYFVRAAVFVDKQW